MKVNWDDDIPNIWENKKMFQTTNQLLIGDVPIKTSIYRRFSIAIFDYRRMIQENTHGKALEIGPNPTGIKMILSLF